MKSSEFDFRSADGLHHKCHQISLNRGGSYIGSPHWLKNKKTTINLNNNNKNVCFKYAVTAEPNHEKTKKDPQITLKIRHHINQYERKEKKIPAGSSDWKNCETNKKPIGFNFLFSFRRS